MAEFDASGMSAGEFCVRRRLKPRTLKWWRWQIGREAGHGVEFVPVTVTPGLVERPTDVLRVVVGDVTVHVRVGDDVGYVGALVAELRARC